MLTCDRVFLDPGDLLAIGRRQIALRRLVWCGARDIEQPPLSIHAGTVGECGIGEEFGRARPVEPGAVDLLGKHIGGRLIGEGARGFVDPDQCGGRRGAACQLRPLTIGKAVEMAEAIAFRPPQQAAIGEQTVIVRKVHPVIAPRRAFSEPHGARTGRRINPQHIDLRLRAVLPLDIDRRSIGRPIDPRDIDIEIEAEIDLHAARAVGVHHEQFDHRIVGARRRVALVEHLGALGPDRGARDDADAGLVGALDDNPRVIGAPPISRQPRHFLLRNELRLAPADGLGLACGGDRLRLRPHRPDPQPPVAHEADIAAARRKQRVQFGPLGIGQPGDGAVEPGQIEIAIERHEHARTVARPLVADDALETGDAGAFALHLLVLGELAPASQLLRIHQHPPFAGLDVVAPQIIAVAIIGAVAQQGKIAAIG